MLVVVSDGILDVGIFAGAEFITALAAKSEGEPGVVTFFALGTSFSDVWGDGLRELAFEAAAIDRTLTGESEVAPGASEFVAASREVALAFKPACGPDVRRSYTFPFVFVAVPGDRLGVSTPCGARPIETLPFMPESEPVVRVCFSVAPVVFKIPASRLAA